MTLQDHKNQSLSPSPRSSTSTIVVASFAVVAAAYFGFVRPSQLHMQSLERQCNKLVIAVKKLQSKDDTARHGLRLINLLEAQNEKLASAEQAVARFAELREQMVEEADRLTQATAALRRMEKVRIDVDRYGRTLAHAATTLDEMAAVSASITESRNAARKANGSLATLSELQANLAQSISLLGEQLSVFELKLNNRSERLPHAELALTQIDQLCEQLTTETASLANAQQKLDQLAGLKDEILEQSINVPAAAATLDQVWDLKDGLLQAKNTLDKAQKLAVDMMLLEPVLNQVTKTLQPVAEATRLSRRAAAKAPKTRQAEASSEAVSPWSSAINVFVALLNGATAN